MPGRVVDLMAMLEASVQAARQSHEPTEPPAKRTVKADPKTAKPAKKATQKPPRRRTG